MRVVNFLINGDKLLLARLEPVISSFGQAVWQVRLLPAFSSAASHNLPTAKASRLASNNFGLLEFNY
jgi:hypothetical protein